MGVILQRGGCPWGGNYPSSCPSGSCPRGSYPRSSCPRILCSVFKSLKSVISLIYVSVVYFIH